MLGGSGVANTTRPNTKRGSSKNNDLEGSIIVERC